MLEEPGLDAERLALERDLLDALKAVLDHRKSGGPASPDAEALTLRQTLPSAADDGLREILKAISGRLSTRACGEPAASGRLSPVLAADRFGPMTVLASPEEAVDHAMKGGRAIIDVAVSRPWWGRLLARPDLRVTGALPDDASAAPLALMIEAAQPGPTGDDRTFWVTDSGLPDARIVEAMGRLGLSAIPLAAAGGLKLFMLAGYVQAEDGRLDQAPGSLKGVIGAAPVF